MDIWASIALSTISSSIFLGILAFLFKSLVGQLLSRDIEKFKIQLEKSYAIELERLRVDLRKEAFEHETKFGNLHVKQMEIIAEVFRRLSKIETRFVWVVLPLFARTGKSHDDDQLKASFAEIIMFHEYFQENRIHLDRKLCDQIFRLEGMLSQLYLSFNTENWTPNMERIGEALTEIPQLREVLESEFRRMLGVQKM